MDPIKDGPPVGVEVKITCQPFVPDFRSATVVTSARILKRRKPPDNEKSSGSHSCSENNIF